MKDEQTSTILVVDDVPMNVALLTHYLSVHKFNTLTAKSGEEVLELVEHTLPDLILLDIMMPGINGFETCQRLKALPVVKEIPIIFMTALSETIDKVKGFELGACDYITKPVQFDEVLSRITTHLSLYKLQKKLTKQNAILQEKNKQLHQMAERLAISERKKYDHDLIELNKAYERFVPKQFLELLDKKTVIDVQLGDQIEKEITISFSDVRGFTSLSEEMEPQEIFDFINNYFGQMEPIILEHHGVIDKYIGDAIMAVFPRCADDAVRGGIEMLNTLNAYNTIVVRAGYRPIHVGIGLNTGRSMIGTIGGQQRMEGTVIGDTVNIAARVESLTKIYKTSLLVTEETLNRLDDPSQYYIRPIDEVTVKGKSIEVAVFEVFNADEPEVVELKQATLNIFEQGIYFYRQKAFIKAEKCFAEVISKNPADRVAKIYLQRCKLNHEESTVFNKHY